LLGGDNRLRGYPSNYFVGHSAVANNLEFRSRPVEILKLQLGGAAFYDVGGVWDGEESLDMSQSAGFGMRALFPQLDRVVFRVDVGFPLAKGGLPPGVSPMSFFASFEQAFPMPNIQPPS
jgi:outer membrane protein assembly factor BamA